MATCTITFSDGPDGKVSISVDFDPPVDKVSDGFQPTQAQKTGWMFLEALEDIYAPGAHSDAEGEDVQSDSPRSDPLPS